MEKEIEINSKSELIEGRISWNGLWAETVTLISGKYKPNERVKILIIRDEET